MSEHDYANIERPAERWWIHHKLVTASMAVALIALGFAAADALALAARTLLAALGLAVVGAVYEVFAQLPEEGKRRFLSSAAVRRTAVVSAALAVSIAFICWFLGWIPLRWMPIALWLGPTLDFIPAAFSLLLPAGWRSGFHQSFNGVPYCFPGPFWWETMRYVRTAIPAYGITFFASLSLFRLVSAAVASRPR